MTGKSEHYQRVEEFMRRAGQETPDCPMIPSQEIRLLRARLILEEALETAWALGVHVRLNDPEQSITIYGIKDLELTPSESYRAEHQPNFVEIADGCADIMVVTTGTLVACGIADMPLQAEVDRANLDKFGPGGYKRADGKWIKPPDHRSPDVASVLERQRWKNDSADG